MRNTIKYAVRRVVRENAIARSRASLLARTERLSTDELAHRQDALLRRTLQSAADHIPAYAGLRGRLPERGLVEFLRQAVPLHGKDELRNNRAHYYPNSGRPRWWWSVGKTSGTTGTPLEVFRSLDSALWEHAFHMQHWSWTGVPLGRWQAVLRGDLVVPLEQTQPPLWFPDRMGRQLFVSTRHLRRETAAVIVAQMKALRVAQLRAYPSAAGELARLNAELGLGLRLDAVITGSEMLYPILRETIEKSFGTRVFDFYGMAERSVFAMQCEHGRMHVHPEYSVVEIVDEAGRPTDGDGYVVGTTLRNLTMPLLRYRSNDTARWGRGPCPCGRSYPVLEGLAGKVNDAVFDLDGQVVNASVITFAFKGAKHIERAQVAQVARDRWEVRVVPTTGFDDSDADTLKRNFEEYVSSRLNVSVVKVPKIANLPSGKYKWVSQEWREHVTLG